MGRPVEKKRKKKGRPSLLDLQKRSIRLQQQQKKGNPNPSPNPYLRFPNNAPSRRITRRNLNPEPQPEVRDDEDEEEEGSGGKRREKKLKLVHRIPESSDKSPRHSGPSVSESEGEVSGSRRKRKIEAVGGDRGRSKVEKHSSSKATVPLQAESSDLGPTTPLPDKKLLLFILDRLQKKDTYGVFSEPVDPEELPDYQDVIEHPMDFSTVRKKLSRGAYKNLEQFEKDVFLISSNAMSYNAPDTVYYRQARSIQELANKNFENLRQESDVEPEAKSVARRGRPPNKTIKQPVAQSSAVPTALDFSSDPTLANPDGSINLSNRSHALSNKGLTTDKPGLTDLSARSSYTMHSSESFGWVSMNKVDANEQYSGSAMGISTKFGKKAPIVDESSRRNTYKEIHAYTYTCELPILSLFDGEKRQLAAVGLHIEYAYARSLARFAAHLGTVGWAIAAKKIEKALPPGTRFGRGWVGDNEVSRQSQPPTQSTSLSYQSSQSTISPCSGVPKGNNKPSQILEPSCSDLPSEGIGKSTPPPVSSPASGGRSSDTKENNESHLEIPTNEADMQLKSPFQIHQNQVMQPIANGFTSGFRFNMSSHAAGYMTRPVRSPMPFGPESPVMHSRAPDMNSNSNNNSLFIHSHSSHLKGEKKLVGTSNTDCSSSNPMVDQKHDAQPQFWGSSMPPKLESIPPDLNVRFQSPASPASTAMLDSQQPDLALQL